MVYGIHKAQIKSLKTTQIIHLSMCVYVAFLPLGCCYPLNTQTFPPKKINNAMFLNDTKMIICISSIINVCLKYWGRWSWSYTYFERSSSSHSQYDCVQISVASSVPYSFGTRKDLPNYSIVESYLISSRESQSVYRFRASLLIMLWICVAYGRKETLNKAHLYVIWFCEVTVNVTHCCRRFLAEHCCW